MLSARKADGAQAWKTAASADPQGIEPQPEKMGRYFHIPPLLLLGMEVSFVRCRLHAARRRDLAQVEGIVVLEVYWGGTGVYLVYFHFAVVFVSLPVAVLENQGIVNWACPR